MANLPIALKAFHIQNFRGIKDTKIEDLPLDAHWIFLTGENGFGKTSVLQGIAVGLTVVDDKKNEISNTSDELVIDNILVTVTYYQKENLFSNLFGLAHFDNDVENFIKNIPKNNANKLIECSAYGSSRLRISADFSREAIEKQNSSIYSLFNTDAVLLNIDQFLINDNAYNPERFKQVIKVFKKLLPRLAEIRIDVIDKIPQVKYSESDENGDRITTDISFTQLAAGYKNIIAMIGDMMYRLSAKQDVKSLSDLEGIVIIDELELHLHPKYQRIFVEKLTELFPKIQFIASTHSPIPLLGAPKGSVILNVERSEDAGITVRRLDEDVDFKNMSPENILASPIFGFDDIIPASNKNLDDLQTESNPEEAKNIANLKKKLRLLKANINVS